MKKSCGSGNVTVSTAQAGLNGKNAYTVTTAQFTIPAVGSTVSVAVSNASQNTGEWAQVGQIIFIEGAGYFEVTASSIISITFENLGYVMNTAPGTIIAIGSYIVPGGIGLGYSGGTQDYVVRWTPDGVTLGNSIIRDNGTKASIGIAPGDALNFAAFTIINSLEQRGVTIANNYTGTGANGAYGLNVTMAAIRTQENIGIYATSVFSSLRNIGVFAGATGASAGINVGGVFDAANGATNYAVKLKDGTEAIGKALICIDNIGYANWGKITNAHTTGATGTFTSADGKTVTVTNGLIVSIV